MIKLGVLHIIDLQHFKIKNTPIKKWKYSNLTKTPFLYSRIEFGICIIKNGCFRSTATLLC